MVELPDVDDGPGGAAADEDDDDAEEHHEHVHLLPQLPLRTKRLWLEFVEVGNDSQVDGEEGNERDDYCEEDPVVRVVNSRLKIGLCHEDTA